MTIWFIYLFLQIKKKKKTEKIPYSCVFTSNPNRNIQPSSMYFTRHPVQHCLHDLFYYRLYVCALSPHCDYNCYFISSPVWIRGLFPFPSLRLRCVPPRVAQRDSLHGWLPGINFCPLGFSTVIYFFLFFFSSFSTLINCLYPLKFS